MMTKRVNKDAERLNPCLKVKKNCVLDKKINKII